jgi:diguanylate cyclase (GGDEF)-like protein
MDAHVEEATWMCPTQADRARILDMQQRFKPVRGLSFVFLAAGLAASIPWLGLWPLPLLAATLLVFVILDHALPGARRPEDLVAVAWVVSVAMIVVACLQSGYVRSPALPWLAIPAVTLPARFRIPVVAAGTAAICVAMLAISFGGSWAAALADPVPVFMNLALVGSIVAFSLALMRSDLDHRTEAFIDPLTGMLNRHALRRRISELTAQAEVNNQPIALILGDLDHFKAVNDRHGHDAGDAVLAQTAYRIRASLRAYDLAYRLGGEEFLVVMPGADAHTALRVAEGLRTAIAAGPLGGVGVTMSFGVSASSGGRFDYDDLFGEADRALYAAKRAGRDRVATAPVTTAPDATAPLAATAMPA